MSLYNSLNIYTSLYKYNNDNKSYEKWTIFISQLNTETIERVSLVIHNCNTDLLI